MLRRVPCRSASTQAASRKPVAPAVAESAAQSHTNIGTFLDSRATKFEWRDAFRDAKTNLRWTYKEFEQQITGYAAGFNVAPGGNRGKTMLSLTGNSAETLVTLLAASRIGASYGVLDATVAEEAGPAIEAAKVSTLIVPTSFEKELQRLIPEWAHPLYTQGVATQGPVNSARHRSLRQVLTTNWQADGSRGPIPLREVFFREPIPNPLPALNNVIAPSSAAVWEQLPHATVSYSHAGILIQADNIARALGLKMEDRVLQALHYSSATAITTSLATFVNGGTLISAGPEPRDPLLTLRALATEHASVLVAPLALYNLIATHPALAKHTFPQLRVAAVVSPAGQAPSAAEIDRIKSVFKAENLLLASTVNEAGIAFVRPLLSNDLTELGKAIQGAEARIDSSSGELLVRTAQARDRRVLGGVSDEWTPTYLRGASRSGSFVLGK